jgi:hypothetical protein
MCSVRFLLDRFVGRAFISSFVFFFLSIRFLLCLHPNVDLVLVLVVYLFSQLVRRTGALDCGTVERHKALVWCTRAQHPSQQLHAALYSLLCVRFNQVALFVRFRAWHCFSLFNFFRSRLSVCWCRTDERESGTDGKVLVTADELGLVTVLDLRARVKVVYLNCYLLKFRRSCFVQMESLHGAGPLTCVSWLNEVQLCTGSSVGVVEFWDLRQPAFVSLSAFFRAGISFIAL